MLWARPSPMSGHFSIGATFQSCWVSLPCSGWSRLTVRRTFETSSLRLWVSSRALATCCDVQRWEDNRGCGGRDHAHRLVDRIVGGGYRADPHLFERGNGDGLVCAALRPLCAPWARYPSIGGSLGVNFPFAPLRVANMTSVAVGSEFPKQQQQ